MVVKKQQCLQCHRIPLADGRLNRLRSVSDEVTYCYKNERTKAKTWGHFGINFYEQPHFTKFTRFYTTIWVNKIA